MVGCVFMVYTKIAIKAAPYWGAGLFVIFADDTSYKITVFKLSEGLLLSLKV